MSEKLGSIKLEKIDHIGIAIKDMDKALKFHTEILGLEANVETSAEFKVKIAFLPLGEVLIELLEPTSPDSDVMKRIKKRGEGLDHIAYRVKDIDDTLNTLKKAGVKLIHEKGVPGGAGSRVAFLSVESTDGVLIELVERKGSEKG
jgi:methylmalonyl-CoA/ethylmalonyl-CoA epimerase